MRPNELATLYVLRCPLLMHKQLWRLLDVDRKTLDIRRLKREIRPYSHGEQLLALVAVSLWSEIGKINLYEMVCTLSSNNLAVVVTALRIAGGELTLLGRGELA
jgi:hypothetical protein